jgi:ABC-type transport system substrate-binding protein
MPLSTDRGRALVLVFRLLFVTMLLSGCDNDPNPPGAEATNTEFTATLQETPKFLDPTASYASDESPITMAVYEPPYRYDYLKRPYTVIGRAANSVAHPYYLDASGQRLPDDAPAEKIAQSVYDIHLRQGIMFAPHPALARDQDGQLVYGHISAKDLEGKYAITDFPQTGTRELVADDYVYAIKRLATPRIKSPSYSVFQKYILGLPELSSALKKADAELRQKLDAGQRDLPFLDMRKFSLPGAEAIDPHTLRIRIVGRYPQFTYWLSTTFFAPVPWEADAFYAQPGMAERDLSLNFWPVGTGAYMVTRYLENRAITLERNPNFRGEPYPCEGSPEDVAAGLTLDCGKTMPFTDRVELIVEKERTPLKNKFLEGYYDEPDLVHPEFGIELSVDARDSPEVAKLMQQHGISYPRSVEPASWYIGFNWLDPVVGKGSTPEQQTRNKKLRQALQIAVNWEEFVQVFERKGGLPAMGPLPPAVFGARTGHSGLDQVAYEWIDNAPRRKSLDQAKKLLAEAGYPDGRDARTGQPLVLNYDFLRIPTPEYKAEIDWAIKQFAKLNIQLEVRATDYNRFQDKMDSGSEQVYFWGWQADYPDAENFMFLLYGPNSKALSHGNGENAANYQNDEFDRLFVEMRTLDNGPQKQALLDRMTEIVQEDSPWLWGYYPYAAGAFPNWLHNGKPSMVLKDFLQYRRIDPELRARELKSWNKPITWPLWLISLAVIASLVPAWRSYRRRERGTALPVQVKAPGRLKG